MTERIFISPQVKQSVIISNNFVCTSCFTSCQTTQDLGSYESKECQENLET